MDNVRTMIRKGMWDIASYMVNNPNDQYASGVYDRSVEMVKIDSLDDYSKMKPYNCPWFFAGCMKWDNRIAEPVDKKDCYVEYEKEINMLKENIRILTDIDDMFDSEKDPKVGYVEKLTAAMRESDRIFEKVGGSTRHYVKDCLIPILAKHGIKIII